MNISQSDAVRLISLLPFGYSWVTRLQRPRDMAYLIATSWLPPIWIAWREGSGSTTAILTAFAAGYLAFISLYEIGYFINDRWDARRHVGGRGRSGHDHGSLWFSAFLLIRLGCWLAIGMLTGWVENSLWLAAYATLVCVFAAHNLIAQPQLRLATFAQLALLRFILPMLAAMNASSLAAASVAAALLYLPLRYLSYADSKDLLAMPSRRSSAFGTAYLALNLPLVLLVAWYFSAPSLAEVGAFLMVAHGVWAWTAGQLSGAKR